MKKKAKIAKHETELLQSRNGFTLMSKAWKVDRDMVTTLKAELAALISKGEK